MVRVDLNAVSVGGLVLGAVAAVFVFLDWQFGVQITVAKVLGPEAPFAQVPLAWIFALAGVVVYLAGRILFLVKTRGGLPAPRKRDRGE